MLDRKLSKLSFYIISTNIPIDISQHSTTITDIFAYIIYFMLVFLEESSDEQNEKGKKNEEDKSHPSSSFYEAYFKVVVVVIQDGKIEAYRFNL